MEHAKWRELVQNLINYYAAHYPKSLGIDGLIRIDNITSTWLGNGTEVNSEDLQYVGQTVTPTATVQTFQNDKLELVATYFSPIEVCYSKLCSV